MKSGEIPSDVSEVTVDWFQAEMPRWEFADGILTLTCSTPGAVIYYTIGGEEPTTASMRYTEPVMLNDNRTVKAFAVVLPAMLAWRLSMPLRWWPSAPIPSLVSRL